MMIPAYLAGHRKEKAVRMPAVRRNEFLRAIVGA